MPTLRERPDEAGGCGVGEDRTRIQDNRGFVILQVLFDAKLALSFSTKQDCKSRFLDLPFRSAPAVLGMTTWFRDTETGDEGPEVKMPHVSQKRRDMGHPRQIRFVK